MKSVLIGLAVSVIGAIGWVFSVVIAVTTLGQIKFFAQFFGILMLSGLPIGILVALLRKKKK